MRKNQNKEHKIWHAFSRLMPYLAATVLIFAVAAFGSKDKTASGTSGLNMTDIAASDGATADQLSELYVVASLASAMNLASTDSVSGNYVSASVLRDIAQTSADKIEKPGYTPVANPRGVVTYIVDADDTMATIAANYGITTDQIRWSNNLKSTDISVGQVLSLPATPGIVYGVKAGDTYQSIASRYNTNIAEMIARNDLESTGLVVGSKIVLPGGVLPLTERPEYVPVFNYSYYGSASDRQNMHVIYEPVNSGGNNRMVWGQCTYYAWWWRWAHGMALPDSLIWGNANNWANAARSLGMVVDKTPSYGAVFQTAQGWYGHVGIVTAVNGDGSITVREMNYGYRSGVATEAIIPASSVGNFNYIH